MSNGPDGQSDACVQRGYVAVWKAEGGSRVLRGASRLLGAVSRGLHGASRF